MNITGSGIEIRNVLSQPHFRYTPTLNVCFKKNGAFFVRLQRKRKILKEELKKRKTGELATSIG